MASPFGCFNVQEFKVQSEHSEHIGYAELKVRADSCDSWLTFECLRRFYA
jgi:hypothetical protein